MLKKELLPSEAEKLEAKTAEVKRMLEREVAKGPIRVKLVGGDRKNKARMRRR